MITKDISANLYKITKGAGISGIGILSVGLLKYITNVVIARNIGPSLYGLFVLGTSIVALLTVISKAGLENGVLKFVAHYKGKEDIYGIKRTIKLVLKVVVMTGLFFTIVIFLTSPYLSLRIFHKPDKKYNFVLKIVGAGEQFKVPEVKIFNQKWSLSRDIEDFHSLDIGVYPLPNDEWVKGKTGFKTIQYMAVGVPCVVSDVGRNKEIIQDGVNGFLANSDHEWIQKLSWLIENTKLRDELGGRGRPDGRGKIFAQG